MLSSPDVLRKSYELSDMGTGGKKVFGEPLEDVVKADKAEIPAVVHHLLDALHENALSVENLFSAEARNTEKVGALRRALDGGEREASLELDRSDVPVVAEVLKLYLRELPDPPFTGARARDALAASDAREAKGRVAALASVLQAIPAANRALIRAVGAFLASYVQAQHGKQAAAEAAGRAFGPLLVLPAHAEAVDRERAAEARRPHPGGATCRPAVTRLTRGGAGGGAAGRVAELEAQLRAEREGHERALAEERRRAAAAPGAGAPGAEAARVKALEEQVKELEEKLEKEKKLRQERSEWAAQSLEAYEKKVAEERRRAAEAQAALERERGEAAAREARLREERGAAVEAARREWEAERERARASGEGPGEESPAASQSALALLGAGGPSPSKEGQLGGPAAIPESLPPEERFARLEKQYGELEGRWRREKGRREQQEAYGREVMEKAEKKVQEERALRKKAEERAKELEAAAAAAAAAKAGAPGEGAGALRSSDDGSGATAEGIARLRKTWERQAREEREAAVARMRHEFETQAEEDLERERERFTGKVKEELAKARKEWEEGEARLRSQWEERTRAEIRAEAAAAAPAAPAKPEEKKEEKGKEGRKVAGGEREELMQLASLGTLVVTAQGAKGLANKDAVGKSDPYAVLTLQEVGDSAVEPQRHRTKVVDNNLDPVWNETYSFHVLREDATLVVHVFDKDIGFTDDFLGEARVPLSDILPALQAGAAAERALPLAPRAGGKDKNIKGDLLLKFAFTPRARPPAAAPAAPAPKADEAAAAGAREELAQQKELAKHLTEGLESERRSRFEAEARAAKLEAEAEAARRDAAAARQAAAAAEAAAEAARSAPAPTPAPAPAAKAAGKGAMAIGELTATVKEVRGLPMLPAGSSFCVATLRGKAARAAWPSGNNKPELELRLPVYAMEDELKVELVEEEEEGPAVRTGRQVPISEAFSSATLAAENWVVLEPQGQALLGLRFQWGPETGDPEADLAVARAQLDLERFKLRRAQQEAKRAAAQAAAAARRGGVLLVEVTGASGVEAGAGEVTCTVSCSGERRAYSAPLVPGAAPAWAGDAEWLFEAAEDRALSVVVSGHGRAEAQLSDFKGLLESRDASRGLLGAPADFEEERWLTLKRASPPKVAGEEAKAEEKAAGEVKVKVKVAMKSLRGYVEQVKEVAETLAEHAKRHAAELDAARAEAAAERARAAEERARAEERLRALEAERAAAAAAAAAKEGAGVGRRRGERELQARLAEKQRKEKEELRRSEAAAEARAAEAAASAAKEAAEAKAAAAAAAGGAGSGKEAAEVADLKDRLARERSLSDALQRESALLRKTLAEGERAGPRPLLGAHPDDDEPPGGPARGPPRGCGGPRSPTRAGAGGSPARSALEARARGMEYERQLARTRRDLEREWTRRQDYAASHAALESELRHLLAASERLLKARPAPPPPRWPTSCAPPASPRRHRPPARSPPRPAPMRPSSAPAAAPSAGGQDGRGGEAVPHDPGAARGGARAAPGAPRSTTPPRRGGRRGAGRGAAGAPAGPHPFAADAAEAKATRRHGPSILSDSKRMQQSSERMQGRVSRLAKELLRVHDEQERMRRQLAADGFLPMHEGYPAVDPRARTLELRDDLAKLSAAAPA
eukprot:tig00021293_g20024.t1